MGHPVFGIFICYDTFLHFIILNNSIYGLGLINSFKIFIQFCENVKEMLLSALSLFKRVSQKFHCAFISSLNHPTRTYMDLSHILYSF